MMVIRRFHVFLLGLLLMAAPVTAQDNAPAEYPTAAALSGIEIPPRDRVALSQALLGVSEIAPPPSEPPLRTTGERAVFNVTNSGDNYTFQVNAILRAVGEHIYLWVEEGAQVSTEELQSLVKRFDERVYPNVRSLWGSEDNPGVDGDPRIYGLFVHGLGDSTAAYFASEHSYPIEAVSTSNEHEMFFFNLDTVTLPLDLDYVESVLAHEFQHMIRDNLQLNEEYWMNEGFSEFSQIYLYDVPVWELAMFAQVPGTQFNTWAEASQDRSQHYGAALLFTTYFYDRYGLEAIRALSADQSSRALEGIDRVLRSMGEPGVNDLFADWVLANFIFDSRVGDGLYGYKTIPNNLISAVPLETITEYPVQREWTVSQYASDYYVLTNLGDAGLLDVRIEVPSTVRLVPAEVYSGQHAWYSNKADMSSTSMTRAFDLTGVKQAQLSYKLWHYTEQDWDFGYVMVSEDGGETWDILPTANTTTNNPHNMAYGPAYTGYSGGWLDETVSLDDYAGKSILVRFQMITDDAVTQPGLMVDDVSIPEIDYFDDFESGPGGWEGEGWLWMDNTLPQQVWVQAVQQISTEVVVSRWLAPDETEWTLPLEANVDQVVLVISPFAPVTTVPMPYTLKVALR